MAVGRLEARVEMTEWAARAWFCSVTRTPDELSIVCPEVEVPDGVRFGRGGRALKLEGLFDLSLTGIWSRWRSRWQRSRSASSP